MTVLQLRRHLDDRRPDRRYYRYAFTTGVQLPRLPEVRRLDRLLHDHHARVRIPTVEYGIGVYGLEKNKMIAGDPNARAVSFFLDGTTRCRCTLVGDGLLPPDIDGKQKPKDDAPAPIVGTQDDGGAVRRDVRRAEHLGVRRQVARRRRSRRSSSKTQLPVAAFDSIFPCAPTAADCLPQPGITDPDQYLDILSYRQRPTWRLAYRNFGTYEALVTNQSVEARPGIAGVRWYEIRRDRTARYSRLPAGHLRARPTASIAGWAASPWTRRATWRSATASSTARRLPGHPLHRPAGRRPARPDDARRGRRSSTAPACRRRRTRAGATTRR